MYPYLFPNKNNLDYNGPFPDYSFFDEKTSLCNRSKFTHIYVNQPQNAIPKIKKSIIKKNTWNAAQLMIMDLSSV